jgi:response regulator RpfG family c-di-GMP phosphodiesterase
MFRKVFGINKWPTYPLSELRKRAKLLVIDDQSFSYVELFNRDGYAIEKWDDVKDLCKLETGYYDIILLDIHGVGREISPKEQGFGVLKHIRSVNPAQIIVAYSNESWSFKYSEFFDLADAKLDKNDDYVAFKEKIDTMLQNRFSLGFYVRKIETEASPYNVNTKKLYSLSENAILTNSPGKLESYLKPIVDNKEIINNILLIASSATQLLSSFKGQP